MKTPLLKTQACIVGGGPAGLMMGFLLARAGVDVVVLEKHADFLRDFRGDTVHPSTMTVMDELGLLDEFLKLPHHKISTMAGYFGSRRMQIADLSHLPVKTPYIAMMPQWDFLDFIAAHARKYPGFKLVVRAEAKGLISEGGKVVGVHATIDGRDEEIRADLVIGADGRHSTVRDQTGLKLDVLGAPMDIMWFRITHKDGDPGEVMGRFNAGGMIVMLDRGDYWQCAYVIPKGTADNVRTGGIEKVRATLSALMPGFEQRLGELETLDDLKLLTVARELVEAGRALHRRCRAYHVADRRRGREHRDPGRGRSFEPVGDTVAREPAEGLRSRGGPGAAVVPGQGDPGSAGRRPERHHRADPGLERRGQGAVAGDPDAVVPGPAPAARPHGGHGLPAGARADEAGYLTVAAAFD
jgi:2-polyprenyl-6-methoxyphenol hydroxylase-like FAD-dependent oxidoreductase